MRVDMDERRNAYDGPLDLPDDYDSQDDGAAGSAAPSLVDELGTLFEDGKTYIEAEIAYQKSRGSFVLDRAKGAIILAVAALVLIHIALIALAVGIVIALVPFIGAWAATAVVAGLLLAVAIALLLKLRDRLGAIGEAFAEKR